MSFFLLFLYIYSFLTVLAYSFHAIVLVISIVLFVVLLFSFIPFLFFFFFFNVTATTEIYTSCHPLSLHDALPISPQSIGSFMSLLFSSPDGWTMIVGGNLVGLAFAALVLTVSAMSFPMLVDRPVDVGTAVATSVRAVAHNPVNMLKWGLIVAVLLLLGSIPVFIGLAVVLPWLGYATWHLYTRVVEKIGEPRRPAA